ncbi:AraC family transcriptional activator of pobA [Chryseobacterium ginsenosidimutans]|uniref:helix-turn-helix domain-containing protein n=1 Tax=Chryseobacterium ginsenosidimutans TaxID=687846 RepID=UPI0027813EE8|nr:AraC family transcriptional regulator [Chryseobacterium ginsenosidimutans]MDQ0594180.1 AraC family transcriptional activator of pobA [Chryseobacterium ginsenosidimutans]
MENANFESNSLFELYQHLNLPVNLIDTSEGFSIFNLKEIGFELPYRSKPYRPNFFSFLFIKDGAGNYTIDDYSFEVKAHSVYFTNPSNYRTFCWERIEEIYLITFDEVFLKKHISKEVFENFPFLLTETVKPKIVTDEFYETIEKVYLQIRSEYIGSSVHKYNIIGHHLAVLFFKIKEYFWQDYNPIYEGNRSSQIVKSFKQLLEKHYRDLSSDKTETVFRVQDYAQAQNLHPNYLSSVIKSKTGKSIATWIAEKTISEAKALLQNSSISIKEITFKLGFSEAAHFSNYFKKHTETTPAQYRKEVSENK